MEDGGCEAVNPHKDQAVRLRGKDRDTRKETV